MGEKVKRKHAQQFRHLQDEAYTELSDPNLFSNRRQLMARAYRCRGRSGDHPSLVGETTTLMPQDDGRVLVLCGNTHVGHVVEEDCSTLVALNREEAVVVVGDVSEQSELTGDFLVVCGPEDEQNDTDGEPDGSR
jgi:hypothetical protein